MGRLIYLALNKKRFSIPNRMLAPEVRVIQYRNKETAISDEYVIWDDEEA